MPDLTVSKESVLRNLANIGATKSKAGRPRSEDKVKEELSQGEARTDFTAEEEGYTVPVDEMFLPGEMADFQTQLKDTKPEDLRVRTAKLTFENRGLKRWIKNAVGQLANAEKGGKVMLPPLPQDVPRALGVEDSNAGVTQMLKEIMPSITQYKLVRDMMRDEDSGGESKDTGVIEYESPDGMKIKMPAGSAMPGFNPFMMQQQQPQPGGNPGKTEENVTIKVGDKELTGPASSMGWMYQAVMQQQQPGAAKEATVKIRDEEGEEREVPASALGAILDLQNRNARHEPAESNITIRDEDGKEVTMPASFYPQFLMQQQLNNQMKQQQQGGGSRRRSDEGYAARGGSGVPDQTMASMYGLMSEMKDAMKTVGETVNPEKLGALAVQGLMNKVEEWDQLKSFFGGGDGEDSEVKKERLKQQGEIARLKIAEEQKSRREDARTAQAEMDARKFEILMNPAGGTGQELEEEEQPRVSLDEAYKKTKAINEEFMVDLQEQAADDELEGEGVDDGESGEGEEFEE